MTSQTSGPLPLGRLTQRLNILQSKSLIILLSLCTLWALGGLIRLLSPLSPHVLPQLAGMTLFHPAAVIVIWMGWKTGLQLSNLLTALLVATFSFAVWNAIMLPGLTWDLVGKTIVSNAIHWLLFLSVGATTARYWQWGTSIGIWADNRKARGATKIPPAKLSIQKLFVLMAIAACIAVAYKSLVLQPSRVSVRTSQLSIFPIQLKPVTSAVLGGGLVSFYWLVTIAILKSGSFRLAGLVLWIPCLTFLRWFFNALYWDAPLSFPGSDALADSVALLEIDGRRYASYVLDFSSPYPAPTQGAHGWVVHAAEAIFEMTLILASLHWFRRNGLIVDFWRPLNRARSSGI
jgi:hypothetical protein